MSRPEEILVAKINATAAIVTTIGASIYPSIYPESGSLPAIVYELTGENPVNYAGGTTATAETKISVHCMASTYSGVKTLAAAVATAISGWTDSDGNIWHLDSSRDEPGDIIAGQDLRHYYGVTQDYSVWN